MRLVYTTGCEQITPWTSTVAMFVTIPGSCEVSVRQETKRQVNAFLNVVFLNSHPSSSDEGVQA
jgi:hypothetical protein